MKDSSKIESKSGSVKNKERESWECLGGKLEHVFVAILTISGYFTLVLHTVNIFLHAIFALIFSKSFKDMKCFLFNFGFPQFHINLVSDDYLAVITVTL
jgi:hypothetical protein